MTIPCHEHHPQSTHLLHPFSRRRWNWKVAKQQMAGPKPEMPQPRLSQWIEFLIALAFQ